MVGLCTIFDGTVFSTKGLQAQFSCCQPLAFFYFVKNYIQGPFAENVTALIKIWRFLKGILPPLAEKMSTSCCLLRGKNCSLFYFTVTLKPFISNYNRNHRHICFCGNKVQIRNDQAAHNFITILPIILHFCLMTDKK